MSTEALGSLNSASFCRETISMKTTYILLVGVEIVVGDQCEVNNSWTLCPTCQGLNIGVHRTQSLACHCRVGKTDEDNSL